MSLIKDCTATKPPSTSSRTTCFLGCFGFSGDTMQPTEEEVNPATRRQRWVFKWKSSFKKSAAKTVPVELTTTTVPRKTKSFTVSPATPNTKTWEIQVVEEEEEEEDATLTKKTLIMVDQNHTNSTRRKKWIDIVKRQNGSYRSRRKDTKAAAVGLPYYLDSPEKKSVTISHDDSIVSSPKKPLTRSVSPPPANGKKLKPPRATTAGGGVDDGVFDKTTPLGGGFDSIIGMSIILVTLVIMMLWGKLCAILCTSAWFFIAPRLGAAAAGERSAVVTAEKRLPESGNILDLESVEYKKKVVLEGLLQRNHRNGVGRL
ncbi:hypothetical protein L6452_17196 [Arctium lappa]|uniref:Uncharacterized protein n=1 Tax=Arctium lappa TaxID=4217 RepID=A0ACB9C2S4_ARCLA|nr:hypothetical protein L6452_17196 [Arctium lappa]